MSWVDGLIDAAARILGTSKPNEPDEYEIMYSQFQDKGINVEKKDADKAQEYLEAKGRGW